VENTGFEGVRSLMVRAEAEKEISRSVATTILYIFCKSSAALPWSISDSAPGYPQHGETVIPGVEFSLGCYIWPTVQPKTMANARSMLFKFIVIRQAISRSE
jgi:hypothetical protein